MDSFNYIAPSILLVFSFFSIFYEPYRWAALIITSAQSVNFLLIDKWEAATNAGSLDGVFFFAFLSTLVMFLMVSSYKAKKQVNLLKFAGIAALFAITHILYISSFYAGFLNSSIYAKVVMVNTYNYYYDIQFILTFCMIILFGKSGIAGFINGVNRARIILNNVGNTGSIISNSVRLRRRNLNRKKV